MNAVRVNELTKSYDGRPVLKGVSMTVACGEIYGFLGPNGAGKTTTLRILLGLLERDTGETLVLDMDPSASGRLLRRSVNALPESYGFYSWMCAEDYLRFFSRLYGRNMSRQDGQSRLEQVGLVPTDRRPIRTFSRGMKQRLGIARAFLNDPRVLFLDEPTNGLDPKGRREIHDLLLASNRQKGMTIIISTHILDDVDRLCGRVGILSNGRLGYEGPLRPEAESSSVRYRFRVQDEGSVPDEWAVPGIGLIGRNGPWLSCLIEGMTPAQAVKALVDRGLPIVEAQPVTGGLEDLYMKHVSGGAQ